MSLEALKPRTPRPAPPAKAQAAPTLADELALWPPAWREAFEERAAVREYLGGFTREEAEELALVDLWTGPPPAEFPVTWTGEWLLEWSLLCRRLLGLYATGRRLTGTPAAPPGGEALVREAVALMDVVPRTEADWLALGRRLASWEARARSRGLLTTQGE